MKITLLNFRKFNPRKDLKSMPWLRLQNNFYDLEDFYDADVNTTWLFIFLLCQCAQKVSETIEFDENYLIYKSKLNKKQFNSALTQLSAKGIILLETNGCDRIRTDSCLTNEHNEHNEHVYGSVSFDLDAIYNAYPKKQGKSKGIDKLEKFITSEEKYNLVLNGVLKYNKYISQNNIEKKFVKQFSTWVNQECWLDDYSLQEDVVDPFASERGLDEFKHEI